MDSNFYDLQYSLNRTFLKRRQVAAARPPRRGEGSRGSVSENANANAVGVGYVRCARAHLTFGLRGAPVESFTTAEDSYLDSYLDSTRYLKIERLYLVSITHSKIDKDRRVQIAISTKIEEYR